MSYVAVIPTPINLHPMAVLIWHYGIARAVRIANGQDRKTEADLAAWRNLGPRNV